MIELRLSTAVVTVTDERVVCRFTDEAAAVCDITQSHGPKYRETAYFWGYSDHVRYAQHHDLTHCWLWDRLYGQPSPTLWAVAHDLPPPPENRDEEHLVNHAQFALAQGRLDELSSFFQWQIGPRWRAVLNDLGATWRRIGLPLPELAA